MFGMKHVPKINSFCNFCHCPFQLPYLGFSVICGHLSFSLPCLAPLLSHMLSPSSLLTRSFSPSLSLSLREHLAGCRFSSGAGCSEDTGESRAVFIPDQQFFFLSAQRNYLLWPSNILWGRKKRQTHFFLPSHHSFSLDPVSSTK